MGGSGVGADRGDSDNLGFEGDRRDTCFNLFDHPPGSELSQEIGAFEVDIDEAVETFFGRLKHVGPRLGRDAGIVHRHIQPAEWDR